MNPKPPSIPDPSPDQSIPRPAHGFARLATWELVSVDTNIAIFKLKDSEFTKQFWSHKFELIYSITLTNTSINCEIVVENTDSTDFEFTCLFHNFMRCSDIRNTWLFGLQNTMFWDAINRKTRVFDKIGDKIHGVTQAEGIDNVYENSKNSCEFHPNGDESEIIELQKSPGFLVAPDSPRIRPGFAPD
jgi:D-hexose-6-phosphate mutarotase